MDVDADDHGEKRIPFSGMDSHIMEMVVIQNPVVYPRSEERRVGKEC